MTGVYTITNLINGKLYVGSSSVNLHKRKNQHFKCLNGNYHDNHYLQNAFNKYGAKNFIFEIIEYCEPYLCLYLEQYWITVLSSYNDNFGYNILYVAGNSLGFKHSKKTIDFLSKIKLGNVPNEETRNKIRNAHLGKIYSEIHRANISKGLAGKNKSDEHKIKLSLCKNPKKVLQCSLDMSPIKEWNSTKEASVALNVDVGNIRGVCSGSKNSAGKFKWQYIYETNNN